MRKKRDESFRLKCVCVLDTSASGRRSYTIQTKNRVEDAVHVNVDEKFNFSHWYGKVVIGHRSDAKKTRQIFSFKMRVCFRYSASQRRFYTIQTKNRGEDACQTCTRKCRRGI